MNNPEVIYDDRDIDYDVINYLEYLYLQQVTVKSECCGEEVTQKLDIQMIALMDGEGICPGCGNDATFLKYSGPQSSPEIMPF